MDKAKAKPKPRLLTQASLCGQHGNRSQILLTDADETCGNQRVQLKKDFMERDVRQLQERIKDLETTLNLNKDIIMELVQGDKAGLNKRVIEKLSKESSDMQGQVAKALEERNFAQSQVLITSQIIEDYKRKEVEAQEDRKTHERELLDQLTRKECMLQARERRCQTLKAIVVKFSRKDPELDQALRELHIQMSEQQAHQVLTTEEGETAIRKDQDRAARLDKQVRDLLKTNEEQAALIHELKLKTGQGSAFHQKPLSILPQFQRQDRPKSNFRESQSPIRSLADIAYQQELEDKVKAASLRVNTLERENLALKQRQSQVEAERDSLFTLNSKLSAALKELQTKLDHLQQKSRTLQGNRSPIFDHGAEENGTFARQAGDHKKKRDSANNKSMIVTPTKINFRFNKQANKLATVFSIDPKEETRDDDGIKERDQEKSEAAQKEMKKRHESSFGELSSIYSKAEDPEIGEEQTKAPPKLFLCLREPKH